MVALPSDVLGVALESADLYQRYEISKHAIQLLEKDEDNRRLHAKLLLVESAAADLHSQLVDEQEHSENLRRLLDEHVVRSQDAEASLLVFEQDNRLQDAEIARLQAEVDSLRSTTRDATGLLAEKLELARELSTLRPEVQYLRAQAASVEKIVSEKLDLQRQIVDAQCEIVDAKAEIKRALAKRRNTIVEIAQEAQVEELRRELAKEKRARTRAEELARQSENAQGDHGTHRELLEARQLHQDLPEGNASLRARLPNAEQRTGAPKAAQTDEAAGHAKTKFINKGSYWVAEGPALDPMTEQLSIGLVGEIGSLKIGMVDTVAKHEPTNQPTKASVKPKISRKKDSTMPFADMPVLVAAEPHHGAPPADEEEVVVVSPPQKTARKRNANALGSHADETSLGTPGDGPRAKRSRTNAAAVGSKSAFSITPFLNKTVLDGDEAQDSEAELSPTRPRQACTSRELSASPEAHDEEETAEPAPVLTEQQPRTSSRADLGEKTRSPAREATKTKSISRTKHKPRKSLAEFETFQKGEHEPVVKQKKRKLGGRGPTLFDEEDQTTERGAHSMSFANRSFFGAAAGSKSASTRNKSMLGSTLLTAGDGSGFQFSPLRRDRKKVG